MKAGSFGRHAEFAGQLTAEARSFRTASAGEGVALTGSGGQNLMQGRSSLRQPWALLVVAGIVLLVFFFAAAPAKAQSSARGPSELWQEYPLDPLSEQGAGVSVQSVRSVQGFRVPTLMRRQRSSSDSTLLFAGFALVVLIISDTSFLMLTRRALARAEE